MNKYLVLLTTIILSACTTTHVDSGYVTQDDPIHHECVKDELWVVNDSGGVNLGEKCE